MAATTEQIEFGPFLLDPANSRLLRDGVEIKLRPQAFNVLRTLIQHGGQLVNYGQLIDEAWEGTRVTRHTVAVTVRELKSVLQEYGSWITCRPKVGYRLESPESEELIRTGWHFWSRRTREGFEKALGCFERAALEHKADSRAWEGISSSWLMLGTYGMRPPLEIYPGFLRAHNQAVALGGLTPELRSVRGHGLHMFERRLVEAESEFLRALREKPKLATTYIRLAILYATMGRLDEALDVVTEARKVDPLWPTLPATEVVLRFCRRDFDAAAAFGKKASDLHPYLQLGRAFYAQALEFAGRKEEALAQYRFARSVSPDLLWLGALEGACLARNGREQEARAILGQLDQIRAKDYVDAYYVTMLREALGERSEAFRELERAVEENSAALYILDVDPQVDSLREDPRFAALRDKLFARAGS